MPVDFVAIRPFTRGSTTYAFGDPIDITGLDDATVASLFRNGWISPYGGGSGGGTPNYAEIVGDGTQTEFTITHGLGTRDIITQAWDTDTDPEEEHFPAWEIVDDNTITAIFPEAPAVDGARVVVNAGGGTSSGEGGGLVGVSLVKTSIQSAASGATTAVTFGSEVFDTHDLHDATTNPSRITVPIGQGGIWEIGGALQLSSEPSDFQIMIRRNGSVVLPTGARPRNQGNGNVYGQFVLSDEDYVELCVTDPSSPVDIRGGHGNQHDATFFARRIG